MGEKQPRDRWTVLAFAVLAAVPVIWILRTGAAAEPSAWIGAVFAFAVGGWIFQRALATSEKAGEGEHPRRPRAPRNR